MLATRNLARLDDVLRQVAPISSPDLLWYLKHDMAPNHRNTVCSFQMDYTKARIFGRLRVGCKIFPQSFCKCCACGCGCRNIAHILQKCASTLECLNTWIGFSSPVERKIRMCLSDEAFAKSLFDLNSFTTEDNQRATITFVWKAVEPARRAAIRHRDAVWRNLAWFCLPKECNKSQKLQSRSKGTAHRAALPNPQAAWTPHM